MKITIDTSADSKEEIRKVISLLRDLVDGPVRSNTRDVFGDTGNEDISSGGDDDESDGDGLGGFANMFGGSDDNKSKVLEEEKEPEVKKGQKVQLY